MHPRRRRLKSTVEPSKKAGVTAVVRASKPRSNSGLLKNSPERGAVSSAPPEGLARSFVVWRRAAVPFALSRNWRTTDSPSAPKSAEFLFCWVPRMTACALPTSSLFAESFKYARTLARFPVMRLFTAIDLPDELLLRVERLISALRSEAFIKWSPIDNVHITTKFIGEWPEARLDELNRALGSVQPRNSFDVEVKGFGWFPNQG